MSHSDSTRANDESSSPAFNSLKAGLFFYGTTVRGSVGIFATDNTEQKSRIHHEKHEGHEEECGAKKEIVCNTKRSKFTERISFRDLRVFRG